MALPPAESSTDTEARRVDGREASALKPVVYMESMRRILRYANMEAFGDESFTSPPSCASPSAAGSVDSSRGEHVSIFFEMEESDAWREFMATVAKSQRHVASVRRRLSTKLWDAHTRKRCPFCWVPAAHCLCAFLDVQRQAILPSASPLVRVAMIMHPEEIMRSSNTGHITAYLLDAPLLVWGIPEDTEACMSASARQALPQWLLPRPDTNASTVRDDSDADDPVDSCARETRSAILYPATGAVMIEDFVAEVIGGAAPSSTADAAATTSTAAVPPVIQLFAFDGTWGQATSLNRHMSPEVPRVALTIDSAYESLFKALRKRTRDTGVSTLEAILLSMEQFMVAMKQHDEAAQVKLVLRDTMMAFVNLQCLLKHRDIQFPMNNTTVELMLERRAMAKREENIRLQRERQKVPLSPEMLRKLIVAPVLTYCYCCETRVGWTGMAVHVQGKKHMHALSKNPHMIPMSRGAVGPLEGHCRRVSHADLVEEEIQ